MEIIHSNKAPEAIGPYSQAIKAGEFLFTSGQIAINPQTSAVEETNIKGQTRQVCLNLGEVLKAAGISFEQVVKTTCFLKNMDDFADFNSVYSEFFISKPARSCVAAKQLPKDVLVEIDVIARL